MPDPHRFCDHSGYRDHRILIGIILLFIMKRRKKEEKIIFRNKPREKFKEKFIKNIVKHSFRSKMYRTAEKDIIENIPLQ